MFEYTIIVEKANKNYSAYCPDLPGCIATGSSSEETIKKMKYAIKFHLEGLTNSILKNLNLLTLYFNCSIINLR